MNSRSVLPLLLLAGCDPYRAWPEAQAVFPWVYTPESGLEPYEEVRWETETWDPSTDTEQAGLYLQKALLHRKGAPIESLAHFAHMRGELPPLGEGLRLSFVGDVMWVGDNWEAFALPAASLLDGALRVGNLETPTAPGFPTEPAELGLYRFNAPPELLDGLPLDALQLTNNHALDVEDAGLEETVAEVAARGLVGVGVDTQARVEVGGRTVALLAYTWGINRRDLVSTHELHVVPFGHLDEEIDLGALAEDIARARADGADTVVVLPHWGYEYEYHADPHFLQLGRRMIEAGADLVVGTGPHVVQPPELCHVNDPGHPPGIGRCGLRTADGVPRTAAILYSLGNFGTTMPTVPCRVGIVATVSLDPDVTGLGWAAVATVDGEAGPELRPLDELLGDSELAEEDTRLRAHLGEGWRR